MSIVVFLGPSLPREEAAELLDADYRPPARAGDVYAASLARPRAIALVDGLFEAVPAVWHKEILHALESGVPVYGASSMGALRAAELQVFGMRGVGRVYQAFATGTLEDDDEVALVHAPAEAGYRPFSEALVNIREGLRQAIAEEVITRADGARLTALAKGLFYPERSWPRLAALGREGGLAAARIEALLAFVKRERPDVKRDDARELLRRLAREAGEGFAPPAPGFRLERSIFFQRLAEAVERRVGGDP